MEEEEAAGAHAGTRGVAGPSMSYGSVASGGGRRERECCVPDAEVPPERGAGRSDPDTSSSAKGPELPSPKSMISVASAYAASSADCPGGADGRGSGAG